jgi:hypothetical protein
LITSKSDRLIRNPDAYLARAVTNYRDDCVTGFSDPFAAKVALWQVAVSVYEIAVDPGPWIDELRAIARDHLKAGQIESTVRSAARRADRRG